MRRMTPKSGKRRTIVGAAETKKNMALTASSLADPQLELIDGRLLWFAHGALRKAVIAGVGASRMPEAQL